MSYVIVIRELRANDEIRVREVVRNAYLSLVTESFLTLLFKEVCGLFIRLLFR